MIWLHHEKEPAFQINKDMVLDYKRTADDVLISIRRELSRQLIYYMVYTDLQQVNNSFFKMMDGLLNDLYLEAVDLKDDNAEFEQYCKAFIKGCQGFVSDEALEYVTKKIDDLKLIIKKLLYVIENYCTEEKSEDRLSNEIYSIF
jgi:hypothetical protein